MQQLIYDDEGGQPTRLKIVKENTQYFEKFRLTGTNIEIAFEDDIAALHWLDSGIHELIEYIKGDKNNDDYVGLTFTDKDKPENPLYVSFRRVDQLCSQVILSCLEKVAQSNGNFLSANKLQITVQHVASPRGFGRIKLKGTTFAEFCRQKSGILVVKNENNMCLAYALCLARARVNDEQHFFRLQTCSTVLDEEARELCEEAGVDLSNGGGLQELRKFQIYLSEYLITVYDNRKGNSIIYSGRNSRCVDKKHLNLIFENNHFNVILSLTAAFSCSYFCEDCHVGYSNRTHHRKCPVLCPCCLSKPKCDENLLNIKCMTCNRYFRGQSCFTYHLRPDKNKQSVCSRLQNCKTCFVTIDKSRRGNKHECGKSFCQTCLCIRDIRHNCYMPIDSKKAAPQNDNPLYIFYDLECTQEERMPGTNKFIHKPNLCIAHKVCNMCKHEPLAESTCSNCGVREKVIEITDNNNCIITSFLEFIISLHPKFNRIAIIAHNMGGYDGHFLLKKIIQDINAWTPKVLMNGNKIILIESSRYRFLDSLNFLPTSLSNLPKMFDIPAQKGYYPHRFNTSQNYSYIGPIPDKEMYDYSSMNVKERKAFLTFYEEEKLKGLLFNNKAELEKYCRIDVNILRIACVKFMETFSNTNDVDVFFESTTIASACSKVFRRRFLKNDVIPIAPRGGYRNADNQSAIALKWLNWMEQEHNIQIQHAGNSQEKRLKEGMLVDGFHEPSNTVFEFFGCYFHGHEKCYPFAQTIDQPGGELFKRREQTEAKCRRIREAGYNFVFIYECEFKKLIDENSRLRQFIDNYSLSNVANLNLRDAFFGGRTNAVKLYYKIKPGEKIMYFDYCSLYPHVNKNSPYTYEHPTIHIGDDACRTLDINSIHGFIKCKVLAPNQLYIPVLPCHINGKLVFPLCKLCAIIEANSNCTHSNTERQFIGTWGLPELRLAKAKGYEVIEIFEIYEYKVIQYDPVTKSGGLFAEYVNNFLKLKVEASGFPPNCMTEETRDNYIKEFYEKEGVQLEKQNIKKNAGLRSLAKLMLNSFWGKFGQREDKPMTHIISNPKDLYEKLIDPAIDIKSIIAVNDDAIIVNSSCKEEFAYPLKTVSLPVANYTTMGARLLLYKILDMLKNQVLYFDTDSIIFVHRPGDELPHTGPFLGDLTNELSEFGPNSYISEFVSGGPKNYAYKVYSPDTQLESTVCKVKGFSLNFKNSQKINFDTVKSLVLSGDDSQAIYSEDYRICRTNDNIVYSKIQSKKYRTVYTKRRRLNDGTFDTLPFGYKSEEDAEDELSKLIRLFPDSYN